MIKYKLCKLGMVEERMSSVIGNEERKTFAIVRIFRHLGVT
jgi:hypothetical protein